MSDQSQLFFTAAGTLPEGFVYRPDFITMDEERALLEGIAELPLEDVRMHGVTARRRVKHFGWIYGYDSWEIEPGPPVPPFLLPLRERAAAWMAVPPDTLEEILISEYRPGATIGWHRDAPMFGPAVLGVSLLGACRFRFRRGKIRRWQMAELTLEPRSAYLIAGPARRDWQHSIPGTKTLRYSITFRTLAEARR